MILLPLMFLAAPLPLQPMVSVTHHDLPLSERAGRVKLHKRVDQAARDFCREHEDEVTPQLMRRNRTYCFKSVRAAIVADMTRPVRRAYQQGLREAGVHLTTF